MTVMDCEAGRTARKPGQWPGTAVLVLAAILLSACATPGSESQCPDPWAFGEDGALVHLPTGVSFPPRFGDLTRGSHESLQECGRDITVVYVHENPKIPIKVNVYLTFRDLLDGVGDAEDYFRGSDYAVGYLNKGARRTSAHRISVPVDGGRVVGGFLGIYRLPEWNGVEAQSELYVFMPGDVGVKVRATYPFAVADAAHRRLDPLIRDFDWESLL